MVKNNKLRNGIKKMYKDFSQRNLPQYVMDRLVLLMKSNSISRTDALVELCECGHDIYFHVPEPSNGCRKKECDCQEFKKREKSATEKVRELRKEIDKNPKLKKEVEGYEDMLEDTPREQDAPSDEEQIKKEIDKYYEKV